MGFYKKYLGKTATQIISVVSVVILFISICVAVVVYIQ